MKLFGWHIPVYRKGATVILADGACARGRTAERLFACLDPGSQFKRNLYGSPKRGAKGRIVSLMKVKDAAGASYIYYGVLVKDVLYAVEESRLARA
ncbi:hypothetical protein ACF3MZ_07125 [Paenibacillaceae bacterium WGS1546]|uniref:hypothetical protein n=1 Tax=Cohnella sp. WGS1546 TaxID=3366810 RepID=UPI00372CFC44